MWAAIKGNLEIVRFLIEVGADIHLKNKYGWTALTEAAGNGHLDTVKLLVESGINIDQQDRFGNTALMWARLNGHFDVVKCLINLGADSKEGITAKGNTAWFQAADKEHFEFMTYLKNKNNDA